MTTLNLTAWPLGQCRCLRTRRLPSANWGKPFSRISEGSENNCNQWISRRYYSRERICFTFLWKLLWDSFCCIVMKIWALKLLLKDTVLVLCTGVSTTAASGPNFSTTAASGPNYLVSCSCTRHVQHSGCGSRILYIFWTTLCSWEHDQVQRDSQLRIWILQFLIVRFILR